MRPYSSVRALCGLSYTGFTGTWALGQFGEIGLDYPKHMQGHMKSTQSLQILILHQMRPYSSVSRPFCGVSYTCFTGTQVLGQFGET